MPEGHTIHRLAREHTKLFRGTRPRASSPQGRFAEGAALLDGRRVERLDAYGKHLFHDLEGGLHLHVHLGLYGRWTSGSLPAPEPRGALRLRLTTDEHWADLRGPTACEVLLPEDKAAILARLGPDPLRRDADPDRAWARLSRSRGPIGALLMDQSVVAGVGNVYRAEVLYRHRVPPLMPGRDLGRARWEGLWADLQHLLEDGVRKGHIVTTHPEHRDRSRGPVRLEDRFYVYRRAGQPCRVCGTEVRTAELVARNLFWCPTCQAL